jgi:membrane protease YdiL (CAAX protease family)
VVEELYFRGYLLPRLSGWGWVALVISALLFACQHFWQPYNILFIFLLVLLEAVIVRWKRNVRFSILCHCFAKSLGAVLTLVALLSR